MIEYKDEDGVPTIDINLKFNKDTCEFVWFKGDKEYYRCHYRTENMGEKSIEQLRLKKEDGLI